MNALVVLGIIAAVLVVIAVKVTISIVKREIRKHGGHLVWWFVSGHHHGGTKECCRAGHCPPRVRWRRARRRLMPLVAVAGIVLAVVWLGSWLLAVPAGLVGALAVLYPRRAHRVGRVLTGPATSAIASRVSLPALPPQVADRTSALTGRASALAELVQHQRRTVEPLAKALAVPIGESAAILGKSLTVPRKITQESRIVAPLPADFQHDPKQLAAVENIAGHRLGHEWTVQTPVRLPAGARGRPVQGRPASAYPGPWLVLIRKPYPPDYLSFAEVADLIVSRGGPQKILAGLTTGREPVWLNFESALAHLALSVGTGGGKSSFLRFLIAQFSYWGAVDFPVIDTAGVSLKGMEAIPGLRVYKKPQEQWDALEAMSLDMDKRLEELDSGVTEFPLCVVPLEEQNEAALVWRAHWKNHPDRVKGSPATPPVYDHTTKLVIGGRKVGYRVVGVYQRMSAAACGGLDAGAYRDQFPTKMLSRYGPNAVRTLTGLTPRQVDNSEINGRFAFISGDRVRYVQAPFAEAPELVSFAMSGKAGEVQATEPAVTVAQPLSLGGEDAITAGRKGWSDSDSDRAARPVLTLVTNRRTLVEHADRQTVPLSYKALSKRRQRDPSFPAGVNKTYTDDEIRGWFATSGGVGEQVTQEA